MDHPLARFDNHAISYDVLRGLAPECSSYLGIGVQEGHCLLNVLAGNPHIERIALFDTWGPHHGGTDRGSHAHIDRLLDNIRWKGSIYYGDGDSLVEVPRLQEFFDLSYVDGDHSEAYAYGDMVNAWERTNKYMVVHDTAFTEVMAALKRFRKERKLPVPYFVHGGTHTAIFSR